MRHRQVQDVDCSRLLDGETELLPRMEVRPTWGRAAPAPVSITWGRAAPAPVSIHMGQGRSCTSLNLDALRWAGFARACLNLTDDRTAALAPCMPFGAKALSVDQHQTNMVPPQDEVAVWKAVTAALRSHRVQCMP